MSVANKITLGRLVLAEISFIFMLANRFDIGFFLILIAVLLDTVDGRVARYMKEVSKQGIFLDIMADKIIIASTFLIIGLKIDVIFFYLGILMILREYSIDTMRSIVASKGKVITSDKFSKIKGVLFMIAMLGAIFNYVFIGNVLIERIMVAIAIGGMVLAYMTLIRFFILYKKLIL